MATRVVLNKKSLPATSSPYYHKQLLEQIAGINKLVDEAGLDDATRKSLFASISSIAATCSKDAAEKVS